MKNKLLFLLVILMAFPILLLAAVQEKVFAGYFDIPTNSPEKTELKFPTQINR